MEVQEELVKAQDRASEVLQLVSFKIGSEDFALNILRVQEIIRFQTLTRVPNLPGYASGVLNLRGHVIPVINLRQLIGLEKANTTERTKIVVVNVAGQTVGFIVDSVSEVLRIDANTVESPPRLGNSERKYISGIGKLADRLLLLLDLDYLLSESERADLSTLSHLEEGSAAVQS